MEVIYEKPNLSLEQKEMVKKAEVTIQDYLNGVYDNEPSAREVLDDYVRNHL